MKLRCKPCLNTSLSPCYTGQPVGGTAEGAFSLAAGVSFLRKKLVKAWKTEVSEFDDVLPKKFGFRPTCRLTIVEVELVVLRPPKGKDKKETVIKSCWKDSLCCYSSILKAAGVTLLGLARERVPPPKKPNKQQGDSPGLLGALQRLVSRAQQQPQNLLGRLSTLVEVASKGQHLEPTKRKKR